MDIQDLPPLDLDAVASNAVARSRASGAVSPKKVALPPAPQENGVMTDIGHGLAAGAMVDVPKMVGQAGMALGIGGEGMVKSAEARESDPAYQTTGMAGAGARGVPAALAAMGLGAAAAASLPVTGAAAGLVAGLPAAGLFGLSSYTDVKQKALSAGAPEDVAEDAGRKAGLIMGVGQAAAAGIGARVLSGAGTLANSVIRKGALENGLQSFVNPNMMKMFGKNFAEMMGVQIPVQAGSAAAMNDVEQGAGINTGQTDLEAAKGSIGPTAVMTSLLAPAGIFGAKLTTQHRALMAETVSGARFDPAELKTPGNVDIRTKQLAEMSRQLRRVAPREEVIAWQEEAQRAIADGLPVEMTGGFTYDGAVQAKAARDAEAATARAAAENAAEQPMLALPNPGTAMPDQSQPARDAFGNEIKPGKSAEEVANDQRWAERNMIERGREQGTEHIDVKAPERDAQGELQNAQDAQRAGRIEENQRTVQGRIADRAGIEIPPVNTEESDRAARIAENQRTVQERVARNSYPDTAGMTVEDRSRRSYGRVRDTIAKPEVQEHTVEHIDVKDTVSNRLKDELPKAPTSVRDRLMAAKGDPQKEAQIARQIIEEKGGEAATQKYVRDLAAFAEKREKQNGQADRTDAKAAPAPDQGAESQRAAGAAKPEDAARAEQVARPQGDAEARPAGASAEKVSGNGQAEAGDEIVPGYSRGAGDAKLGAARNKAALDAVVARTALPETFKLSDKERATLPSFVERRKQSVPVENDRRAMTSERAASALAQGDENAATPVQQEQVASRQAAAGQGPRRTEADVKAARALREKGDATKGGKQQAEPVREVGQQAEPVREGKVSRGFFPSYSDPAVTKYGHLEKTQYLADLRSAGKASKEQVDAISERNRFKETLSDKRDAEARLAAFEKLPSEQKKRLVALADQHVRSVALAKKFAHTARAEEQKVQRSIREETMTEQDFNDRLSINDRNLAAKAITPEQHERNILDAMSEAIDQAAVKNRGLAAMNDETLAPVVKSDPHASVMMDHIARVHHDPVMRKIAGMLADHSPNAHIEVIEQPDFNGGRYRTDRNVIEIGRGGLNPITLVHETTHALSHAGIDRARINEGRAGLSAKETREVEALNTIRDVMKKFEGVADARDPAHMHALEDEHEFLSEALANRDMQALLDQKKLWQRVVDAVRGWIGFEPKYQSDMENLLRVAPELFGHPDRSTMQVFHDALSAASVDDKGNYKNTPRGYVGRFTNSGQQLARLSDASKWDVKGALLRGMLRWTSYNNGMQWLERRAQNLIAAHPEHAGKINAFTQAFRGPKSVIEHRNALSQHLLNATQESSDVTRQMAKVAAEHPQAFKNMAELGRRARQAGVDPRDSTLTAARKRNSAVTADMFDAPIAKQVRADWARIKDTPAGKLYERIRQHNELSFARHYATLLNEVRNAYGVGRDSDLDWWSHTKDANGFAQRDPQVQLDKLNSTIARSRGQAKAGTNGEYNTAVAALLTEYDRQRGTPYIHFGRTGDHYVHFEVKPEFYEAVRKIVTGDPMKAGGLGRDMGPDTGMRVVNMAFDSPSQHSYAIKQLEALQKQGAFHKLGDDGKEVSTWSAGTQVDRFSATDGATPLFIRKLQERIRESVDIPDDMKDRMVREITDAHIAAMPDTNPMQAQRFADKAQGSSTDLIETFARRQTMSNNGLVSAYSHAHLGGALADLNSAMKAIKTTPGMDAVAREFANYENEVKERIADMQVPVRTPMFDWMRALAAPFRLALSPAYMAMVAYQPLQMTLPVLGANHGWVAASGALARNYGTSYSILNHMFKTAWDINSDTNLWQRMVDTANPTIDFDMKNADGSPALHATTRELMHRLQWSGLINFGQMQQIWRPQDASEAVVKPLGKVGEANRIASAIPHYIEMSNRIVAALTAHELALTKGAKTEAQRLKMLDSATPEQREAAAKYAMQIIRNTDGDHSQGNIARMLGRRGFARGATPLIVGFNQYDFQMTESVVRLAMQSVKGENKAQAQKAIAGIFAMTGLMAGTLGLPFMGMFAGLYNRIGSALQDSEDTPPDFEKGVRDFIDHTFGEKAGEIVARGVPRAFDIDMSNRSGYQDLAPFTDALKDRQKLGDTIKDQATNFLGPAVGVWVGMATGARAAYEGNYPKAINDALPAFMRNTAKAWRMSQYGYEREGAANEQIPIDVSSWNVMAQAAGFTGGRKTDLTEKQFQWNTNQDLMKQRMAITRDNWLRAMDHHDGREIGNQMENIVKFATAQPQFAHVPMTLAADYKQRATELALAGAMGGAHVPMKQIPYYNQFTTGSMFPPFPE
jgi:hypothetical protein